MPHNRIHALKFAILAADSTASRELSKNASDECFYYRCQEESCSLATQDNYSELVVTNSLIVTSHYLATLALSHSCNRL